MEPTTVYLLKLLPNSTKFPASAHPDQTEKEHVDGGRIETSLQSITAHDNKALGIVHKRQNGPGVHRTAIKSLTDRERCRGFWKNMLHLVLRDEFMLCRSAGVKVKRKILRQAAISIVNDDSVSATQLGIENKTQKKLNEVLTMRWLDDFCDRFRISTRRRTSNKERKTSCMPMFHAGKTVSP